MEVMDVTQGKIADPRSLAVQGISRLTFGSDDSLNVRFYVEAVPVPALGGFEDREFIEITIPGGDSAVHEVSDFDRQRFPQQYAAWKRGQTEIVGTPLSSVPFIKSPSMVKQLAAYGVDSCEQLAALDDLAIQKIRGGLDLRAKAQTYLQSASDSEVVAKQEAARAELEAERAELRCANAELAEQVAELSKTVRDMVAAKELQDGKKEKGRP